MAEKLRRPGPFTPLSATFHTGRTGTAILDEFGLEGLAVWAAMLAQARHEQGLIVFRHDEDWAAIGLAAHPPSFALKTFLTFLGRRKQTRTTRQGRVHYVELTQWTRWNQIKDRAESAWRKSRIRAQSKRDKSETAEGQERDLARVAREEPEPEPESDTPLNPPEGGRMTKRELRRYTGCRIVRGSHGSNFVRDPLGTDPPPATWPHEPPSADEVAKALSETNGTTRSFEQAAQYVERVGWEDPHLEDELRDRFRDLQPDELADLLGKAKEIASRQETAA